MAKECRKGVYTLYEIGEKAYKTYPGRFKNINSAYASARTYARECSVGDINGKGKYKQIAAVDAAKIWVRFEETSGKKKPQSSGPKQGDLFSLLGEPAAIAEKDAAKALETIKKNFDGPLLLKAEETEPELKAEGLDALRLALKNAAAVLEDLAGVLDQLAKGVK